MGSGVTSQVDAQVGCVGLRTLGTIHDAHEDVGGGRRCI
jgi:hypothetical protein